MEEKSIKDFDRTIEQAMNEYSVAPPFGMWNRISAELGNPEGAVVAPKPTTALPKGLLAGFIAGALVIGSTITGILVYNGNNNLPAVSNGNTPILQQIDNTQGVVNANSTPPAIINNTTTENNTTIVDEEPVVPKVKTMVITALTTKASNPVKQANATVAHIDTNPMGVNAMSNNNDVAVPQIAVGNKATSTDAYYFPPVDINIPGEKVDAKSTADNNDNDAVDVKNNDTKKVISRSSSSSPERIKFKKRRRTHYTYPTIVRRKR
jgi:hypothetical protein